MIMIILMTHQENTQYDISKPILLEAHNEPKSKWQKMTWFWRFGGGFYCG